MSDDFEFELTADEIEELDEMHFDRMAVDNTLQQALNHHANRMNEINKQQKKWWDKLLLPRGLDPTDRYKTARARGKVVCVLSDRDEEKNHD